MASSFAAASDGTERHGRRVGPQSAAVAGRWRAAGPGVLLRQTRLHRNVPVGPWTRTRLPCRHGTGSRGPAIAGLAESGDADARAAIERYAHRLARSLASVINVLDPDVIVLGGGMSNVQRLYTRVPELLPQFVFSDRVDNVIRPPRQGDSSGVRGAAWLWNE